jgi:hypothetical protein
VTRALLGLAAVVALLGGCDAADGGGMVPQASSSRTSSAAAGPTAGHAMVSPDTSAPTAGTGAPTGAAGVPTTGVGTPATPTPPAATATPAARIVPRRVRIPSIGVDTTLERLRVDGKGVLQPPRDPDLAGWFSGSAVPGELGPAVIAGHVDSTSGPAVFARLSRIELGDAVDVRRSDGRTVRFHVVDLQRFHRSDFPADAVYGPTPDRTLRLITCDGPYRHDGSGYRDNLVVTAVA